MRLLRTTGIVHAAVVATCVCLTWLSVCPASAIPYAAKAARDRAALKLALERLDEVEWRAADVQSRIDKATDELDRVMYEQQQAQAQLNARARSIYRSGNGTLLWALLGAESLQDLASRWDFMMRIIRQDSANLDALNAARTKAQETARSLMALQAEQQQAVDQAAREVAFARKQLSDSETALGEYEERLSASEAAAAAQALPKERERDPMQDLRGSGEWQTAVASHYARDFEGRGASGVEIGPYSMIVAHRTLPFGTLIEFEYNGRRAVASVEDRGPHTEGREFDLGPGVTRALDFAGVDEVRYRIISQ